VRHPGLPNDERVIRESAGFTGVIEMLIADGLLSVPEDFRARVAAKKRKVEGSLLYSRQCGTLDVGQSPIEAPEAARDCDATVLLRDLTPWSSALAIALQSAAPTDTLPLLAGEFLLHRGLHDSAAALTQSIGSDAGQSQRACRPQPYVPFAKNSRLLPIWQRTVTRRGSRKPVRDLRKFAPRLVAH
jgi:hypothetical protein